MSERWQRAKELFQTALESTEAERERILGECTDADLRAHVRELLRLHFEENGFLETPLAASETTRGNPMIDAEFGSFKVVRELGRGGMGVVYEGSQQEPKRTVALKVLSQDFAKNDAQLKRFRRESEILARLQHPGIAHIYQAGLHEFDNQLRPWFAMEFIDGGTLREFLATRELMLDEKLDLFIKICDAVQHAHDRQVIHRDLKPANILIQANATKCTSKEQPKVVDFGIARVADACRDATQLTSTQDILGTLNYLSPEQVMDIENVDHRCDVYSLGVILFEMLSGRLPHDRSTHSIAHVLAKMETTEARPLREFGVDFPVDLEVVLAKALEIAPARRYPTVRQFVDDIVRFQNDQPILARRASAAYRIAKFCSRNKALVVGTLTTILALAGGLAVYVSEAKNARLAAEQATYEAEKSSEVSSFLTNDFMTRLLTAVGSRSADDPASITDLVASSTSNVDAMFADKPTHLAAVRNEIGTIYYNLGRPRKAAEQYAMARDIWREELGADHRDTLKAVNNFAQASMHFEPDSSMVESLLRDAYARRCKALGESNPATQISLNNLADHLRRHQKVEEAESLFKRGLAIQIEEYGYGNKTTQTMAGNLGSLYIKQGKPEAARELHKRSFESAKETLGHDHIVTMIAGIKYAQTLDTLKEYDSAALILERLAAIHNDNIGTDLFSVINVRRLLARVYRHADKRAKAKGCLERALELLAGRDDPRFVQQRKKIERDLRRIE